MATTVVRVWVIPGCVGVVEKAALPTATDATLVAGAIAFRFIKFSAGVWMLATGRRLTAAEFTLVVRASAAMRAVIFIVVCIST